MLFAEKIKSLREERKLLQRELAAALDIDVPMYSRIERGERPIKREQIKLIADILEYDERELLKLWLADQVSAVLDGDNEIINDVLDIAKSDMNRMKNKKNKYSFIDLFAGIGGFHQAMHSVGMECVFASELDDNARASYKANYQSLAPNIFDDDNELFNHDITQQNPNEIPEFDVCCGGFPCQPFSIAGLRRGFEDTRGTLFFNIANIVKQKIDAGTPPKILFLENVKGLKNHMKGQTLKTILATLTELGYNYSYDVLNAKYFGVPQNRERLFIVAWHKELIKVDKFNFPYGIRPDGSTIYEKTKNLSDIVIKTRVSDIFEPDDSIDPSYTISDRMWIGHQNRKQRNKENGKGFGYSLFNNDSVYCSTISARYWKDGSEILIDQSDKGLNPRKLTPVEAGRLQGYNIEGNGWRNPKNSINVKENIPFEIVVSKKEAYRQFGNSVAIPVIKRLAKEIVEQLLEKQ